MGCFVQTAQLSHVGLGLRHLLSELEETFGKESKAAVSRDLVVEHGGPCPRGGG